MAQPRDARGRFTKSSGQSLGEAVGRFRIDTSGIAGAGQVVSSVARKIDAEGGRISTAIRGINQQFTQAKIRADAFANSDLGRLQKNLDNLRRSTQVASAIAAGIVGIGVAAASNINAINARFTVFLGSATAAKKELDNIRKIADATGQSFIELVLTGADLLSVAKNYKVEVGGLLTIAQQLKAVDPTARSLDTSRAIREFLSGNNKTLNAVFELDKDGLDKISEGATDAADRLQRLSKYLSDLGFGNDILKALGDQGLFTFDSLKSEIEEALGTAFMPLLKDFLLPGAKALGGLIRGIREANPELLKFAAAGVVIVAGFAPALLIISQLITAYKNLKTVSALGSLGKGAGVGLAVGGGVGIGLAGANLLAKNTNLQTGDLNRIRAGESAQDILGERLKQSLVIIVALVIKAVQVVADVLTSGANLIKQAIELIASVFQLGLSIFQQGFGQIQKAFGEILLSLADLIRKIPGQEGTANNFESAGLASLASGSDAVNQGSLGQRAAQDRLARGLDLSETQKALDDTNKKFEDLQNGVVEALNAFLFPQDKLADAADETAKALDKVTEATNPMAAKLIAAKDEIEALAKDIAKQRADFDREQKQINDERGIQSARDNFDFTLGRSRDAADRVRDTAREEADLARSRAKQIRALINDINQAEAEALAQRYDLIAANNEALARQAEDHGKKLAQIAEQTNLNVRNAAARLDANAVFEALAAGTAATNQENDSFNTERRRKEEDLAKQLTDLDAGLKKQRDARLAALAAQFADEDAERVISNQRKAEDLALTQKREDDDRALRLNRQTEDYARQDRLRREAFQRQINDQITALSASTGINQRMLTTVINGMVTAGGAVKNFVDYVNQQVARLGVSANGNVPQGSSNRVSTRITPTFANGGSPPLNRVIRANEAGLESALINNRYFAMLSQPAQILNAQQTQQLLAGATAGGGGGGRPLIENFAPVFNDVGSYNPEQLMGLMRRAIVEAAEDVRALGGTD